MPQCIHFSPFSSLVLNQVDISKFKNASFFTLLESVFWDGVESSHSLEFYQKFTAENGIKKSRPNIKLCVSTKRGLSSDLHHPLR